MPGEQHVAELLDFVRGWDRRAPLVVHCYHGHQPLDRERVRERLRAQPAPRRDGIAQALRRASPTATPNIRIVSLADRLLGRDGRMVAAIETIGRGVMIAGSGAVPARPGVNIQDAGLFVAATAAASAARSAIGVAAGSRRGSPLISWARGLRW